MKELIDLVLFNDLKALQKLALKLETNTYIIAQYFSIQSLEKIKKEIQNTDFDFKLCHILSTEDPAQAKKFKQKVDLIAVLGGKVNLNKFGVTNKNIDLLLCPVTEKKFEFDTAITQTAFENNKPIALLFSQFLDLQGIKRANLFRNYFFALKLCKKFKIPMLFFSGAKNENQLRSPKNLFNLATLFRYSPEQANHFLEMALQLFEKSGIPGYKVLE